MLWSRTTKRLGAAIVVSLLPVTAAQAVPDKSQKDIAQQEVKSSEPSLVPPGKRGEVLGREWQKSGDVAWTTSGDADGFHILAAKAAEGYEWRTVATLSERGFDADQWIGNVCATGSGKRLVVVYAPRTFTNKAELFDRGGFTATVDLESGAVTKLPVQSTLAYYNPGCGTGETAVVTQEGVETLGKTRLFEVDAAKNTVGKAIEVPGQLTSSIPTKNGIVAADSGGVVTVNAQGKRELLAKSAQLPFRLRADADGGVVFMDREGADGVVRRVDRVGKGAKVAALARGPLMEIGLAASAAGKVFVTGKVAKLSPLPRTVKRLDVSNESTMSTLGELAVTSVLRAKNPDPRTPVRDPFAARPVRVEARSATTGKPVAFTVDPAATDAGDSGRAPHPKLGTPSGEMSAQGSPDSPLDPAEQVCAIARNNPNIQVYQPTARQVEWAVDYAVDSALTITREANWKNSGMPVSWQPQSMFPPIPLEGGGKVPPQVFLGIIAQESNMWQAARFALPGVTSNPLIGNFYGVDLYNGDQSDDWNINWAKADCGYGVTQITDGMRLAGKEKPGETALSPNQQRAVAVDFATNVAAGLRILQEKWNTTRRHGLMINNGDVNKAENWFFAIWAYNSGFNYPDASQSKPWGVGWANNPVNPKYSPTRKPFLEYGYGDAAHPQDWPYPEKVLGWAGHPIESWEEPGKVVSGFNYLTWNGWDENADPSEDPGDGTPSSQQNRRDVKPPYYLFCSVDKNNCDLTKKFTPNKPDDPNTPEDEGTIGEDAGPCGHQDANGYYDLRCWWHHTATWKDNCDRDCAVWTNRFRDPDIGYQPDGRSYPPNCKRDGLPGDALIVDDVPTGTAAHSTSQRPCANNWANEGSFSLDFANTSGTYPSKIDFHQLGAGFGGHFWFSHTNQADDIGYKLKVTGTWKLNRGLNQWARVLVHMPDHGAHTQQARYDIDRGNGVFERSRYLSQGTEANKWVSLGVYQFNGIPRVRLGNITADGRLVNDIAWDAIAFQPLTAKPKHIVAVLGDSYTSGEGAGDYFKESDNNHGTLDWNACRRSRNAWIRQTVLSGQQENLGQLADRFAPDAELGFVACSGADTNFIMDKPQPAWHTNDVKDYAELGNGQFREIGQINSGALDENTTMVAMTMGANNDSMFTDGITACILSPSCGEAGGHEAFLAKYKQIVDRNMEAYRTTLTAVSDKAKNAKIVLLGYPRLFNEGDNVCNIQAITGPVAAPLNRLAEYIAQKQKEVVDGLAAANRKVYFASALDHFDQHRICDSVPWINGVKLGPNGEGDFHRGDPDAKCIPVPRMTPDPCVSRESFHPSSAGAAGYSLLLQRRLSEIGYQGS
ncbi:hypothetical protein Lesp02_52010 [Lentzea sp. NBRC 105346]|uniref:SGNH/GDSL hydrolase family protein n=1 Tax=Lentzea sp. NBRC 105346 TaxID=3032205 RepID=UPI0024A4792F|nr:SGNH/GDSL hydrolase family protein [Lentzea sp. NBRC 105346]GLZ33013.1 hypothetical protein Lesp02_52010 [Lentzea sp. NBRC 105346]